MATIAPDCVLVFDLDDTLYLERDFARSGFAAVGEWARDTHSLDGVERIAADLFDRGQRERIFDGVLAGLGLEHDQNLIRDMVEIYRFHPPKITLQPDTQALFSSFAADQKLALITDGHQRTQENKVAALQLEKHGFDPIFVTDAWGRDYWKPHRRAYEAVVDHFGERGHRFVYIADNSRKDFLAPNAMGWATVRIAREGRVHDGEPPSERHAAMTRIVTLAELPQELEALLASTATR